MYRAHADACEAKTGLRSGADGDLVNTPTYIRIKWLLRFSSAKFRELVKRSYITDHVSKNQAEVMAAWSVVDARAVGILDVWSTSAGDSLEPIKDLVYDPDGELADSKRSRTFE